MQILKNAGTFKVLDMTFNPIKKIASAARTCYQSQEFASEEKDKKLVEHLIKRGHHAMLEFADMTVQFNDVCRGFTHEMVRHRLVSYAQESTRYVDESDFKVVVPPHKDENEKFSSDGKTYRKIDDKRVEHLQYLEDKGFSLKEWFELNEAFYRTLRGKGWKPEDARQVLPIATKSQIVVKANMREWRHIFDMRCAKHAHWEIRGVMLQLLKWCQDNIPLIFDDFVIKENDYAGKINF